MPKFALLVAMKSPARDEATRDIAHEAYEVLRALGHSESDARRLLDNALDKKKKFKDVESLLHAVYQQRQTS